MKKSLSILFFLIFINYAVKSQYPVITMIFAKDIGSTISFQLTAASANTTIQVDFGDGTLVDKIIDNSVTLVSGPLAGSQIVKVYGNTLVDLVCDNC